MPIADMPPMPVLNDRIVCSLAAAIKYDVPANILLAIAEQEGGKPGQWVANSNGTYDIGAMQFNTAYLNELKRYGITAEHVALAGCYPYDLAAWRIHQHLTNDTGDIWTRAANYHSRTYHYNQVYQHQLKPKALRWQTWLEQHFTAERLAYIAQLATTISADTPKLNLNKPATAIVSGINFHYVPRQIRSSNK